MYIPGLDFCPEGVSSRWATELVRPVGNSDPATPQVRSVRETRIAPRRMKLPIYLIGIFLILVTSGFMEAATSAAQEMAGPWVRWCTM